MPGLRPEIDPDGLLEYSVVYTDRALERLGLFGLDKLQNIDRTVETFEAVLNQL